MRFQITLKEVLGFGIGLALISWLFSFLTAIGLNIPDVSLMPSNILILMYGIDAIGYGISYIIIKWILSKMFLLSEGKVTIRESIAFGIGMSILFSIMPFVFLLFIGGTAGFNMSVLLMAISLATLISAIILTIKYAIVKWILLQMRVI